VPRRLLELSAAISSSNATTIEQVRHILGLHWVTDASPCAALCCRHPQLRKVRLNCRQFGIPARQVRRVRLVFVEIYCVNESGKARRSAFLHLDGDPINELAMALRDRAAEIGVSSLDLWAAISQRWAADGHDF
jgi:hypothetical protein